MSATYQAALERLRNLEFVYFCATDGRVIKIAPCNLIFTLTEAIFCGSHGTHESSTRYPLALLGSTRWEAIALRKASNQRKLAELGRAVEAAQTAFKTLEKLQEVIIALEAKEDK